MKRTTPEQVGISSRSIENFVRYLETKQFSTHALILSRGDQIIFEKYWAPFTADTLHRMYSVSKSFVSLAIGFLEQEGKIDLDDPIIKYFPEELKDQKDENMRSQTIRHMLMMSTAKLERHWFEAKPKDRVRFYFENDRPETRPSGTIWQYDSTGSFIMGALVERVTGKKLMDYLREKVLDRIGFSKEAHMLQCPGGHSWGDSSLLCQTMDLWKTCRFIMDHGRINGEPVLNETYLDLATGKQIDNNVLGAFTANAQGYGYQFWRTYENSYMMNGMGSQYAICVPDQDMIMVINSDNQGVEGAFEAIVSGFFREVVDTAAPEALPEDVAAQESLAEYTKDLKLMTAKGDMSSDLAETVNGRTYQLQDNAMGIKWIRLHFDGAQGSLAYENEQGEKELPFGMGENIFGLFPQKGYSDQVGTEYPEDHQYRCATSAAWIEPTKLFIKVQVIDDYLGRLNINLGFREDGSKVGIFMNKSAEDFLNEYEGYASGSCES